MASDNKESEDPFERWDQEQRKRSLRWFRRPEVDPDSYAGRLLGSRQRDREKAANQQPEGGNPNLGQQGREKNSAQQAYEKADDQHPEGDSPNSAASLADRGEPDDQGRDRRGLSANLRELGEFLGDWLKRRYSSVRVIARMKVAAFTLLLAFLGFGFTLKIAALNASMGAAGIEFILASPDPLQSISAAISFAFVVSANLYSRWTTTNDERGLLELAARPDTPPEVRSAILKKLQG